MSARSIVVLSAGLAVLAGSASAQGTYVSASVAADISRFSRASSEGSPDFSGSGEAIGRAEARIVLAGHVELVPGVRLMGLDNGRLVRPSVGLGWTF